MEAHAATTCNADGGCRYIVPRQRQFRADLVVVNDCLDELIALAKRTQEPEDIEALQSRDYSKVGAGCAWGWDIAQHIRPWLRPAKSPTRA